MNLKDNQIKSRFSFPVTLTTDEVDGGYTVTFRDLPEAITQGENIEDALVEASDCLEEAISQRLALRAPRSGSLRDRILNKKFFLKLIISLKSDQSVLKKRSQKNN